MENQLFEQILARLDQMAAQSAAALKQTAQSMAAIERLTARVAALEAASPSTTPTVMEPVVLASEALTLNTPKNKGVILCLDFGTARSKAFATDSDVLLDLAIGQRAGHGGATHSVLSCIFITDEGRIHFGEAAASMSELPVMNGGRRRIDSIKAMITNSAPGSDLTAVFCDSAVNPTDAKLSDGDLLTLYLAYLTDMAGLELSARHGKSRYVLRRFTTPVFDQKQQQWADETLRHHYCEAVLVADYFTGRWNDGIEVKEALRVVRASRRDRERVRYLTGDPLMEPIAAFASRFRGFTSTEQRRVLITIIDAGAGTIDFATFAISENLNAGLTMFTVQGSIHVFKKAGNEIDRILHKYILDQAQQKHAGIDKATMARIEADLSLQQRRIKEELFRDGRREYQLADGTRGEIILADFLNLDAVKVFAADLQMEFVKSLKGMDPSWIRECGRYKLYVVATGGSAGLPMVAALGKLNPRVNEIPTECHGMATIPAWVSTKYPELAQQYPQLAVAIGGAQPVLPTYSEKQYVQFEGLSDAGKWVIEPALRGA
jgi:molecular chaperone HscA